MEIIKQLTNNIILSMHTTLKLLNKSFVSYKYYSKFNFIIK